MNFLHTFVLAFIPLFVAMDPIGIIPLYISFTQQMDSRARRRLTWEALGAAFAVTMAFMFVGKALFNTLGITIPDFQIAGGLLLVVMSIQDMVSSTKELRDPGPNVEAGVVPLGIPLIAGPAVLTTELLLLQQHGVTPTASALVANLIVTALGFKLSTGITKLLGSGGVRAVSKIFSLLMAAIAIMMIRVGIETIIRGR